jgi:hypothetical protein
VIAAAVSATPPVFSISRRRDKFSGRPFNVFQCGRNVVGNVKLRAAVEKIIGGRKLRANFLRGKKPAAAAANYF